jgi:hypothetical protein
LNPNYVFIAKQDINKLLIVGFTKLVEEATWLSLIMVVVRKNGKLRIYLILGNSMQQQKNIFTFFLMDEVINTIVGHEVYTFMDSF